jgi:hypothetical protein
MMFLFSQGARRSRLQSRISMPSRRAPRRASRGLSRAGGWPAVRLVLVLLGVLFARQAAAQAPPCTVTVSQTELDVSQPGTTGIVTVTVSDPTCVDGRPGRAVGTRGVGPEADRLRRPGHWQREFRLRRGRQSRVVDAIDVDPRLNVPWQRRSDHGHHPIHLVNRPYRYGGGASVRRLTSPG